MNIFLILLLLPTTIFACWEVNDVKNFSISNNIDPSDFCILENGVYIMVYESGHSINFNINGDTGPTYPTPYYEATSGAPDLSVTENECYAEATRRGITDATAWDYIGWPKGCVKTSDTQFRYNTVGSTSCSVTYPCIQRRIAYYEATSGTPDRSVTEYECKNLDNYTWGGTVSIQGEIKGCYLILSTGTVYYNTDSTSVAGCNLGGRACIQRRSGYYQASSYYPASSGAPDMSIMDAAECQAYAEDTSWLNWNRVDSWSTFHKGCSVYASNGNVYFNTQDTAHDCGDIGHNCIQRHTGYYQARSGAPDLSVTKDECRDYAGENWGAYQDPPNAPYTSNLHQSGCFELGESIYYNHNMNSTVDCARLRTPCIQKPSDVLIDTTYPLRVYAIELSVSSIKVLCGDNEIYVAWAEELQKGSGMPEKNVKMAKFAFNKSKLIGDIPGQVFTRMGDIIDLSENAIQQNPIEATLQDFIKTETGVAALIHIKEFAGKNVYLIPHISIYENSQLSFKRSTIKTGQNARLLQKQNKNFILLSIDDTDDGENPTFFTEEFADTNIVQYILDDVPQYFSADLTINGDLALIYKDDDDRLKLKINKNEVLLEEETNDPYITVYTYNNVVVVIYQKYDGSSPLIMKEFNLDLIESATKTIVSGIDTKYLCDFIATNGTILFRYKNSNFFVSELENKCVTIQGPVADDDEGLGVGAIVGISVGIVAFVGAGIWYCLSRRSQGTKGATYQGLNTERQRRLQF